MYEKHPTFVEPMDENTRIWRYMPLEGLLSLIDRKSLFFVKASQLDDPLEGRIPMFNDETAYSVYEAAFPSAFGNKEAFSKFRRTLATSYKRLKEFILINSWHLSDNETVTMWRVPESGILIQSTFKKLRDSFRGNHIDTIHIGLVRYIDFKKEWMPEGNFFEAFVTKRKHFEPEGEIRAVTMLPLGPESGFLPSTDGETTIQPKRILDPSEILPKGKYVSVDVDELIGQVYVAPKSPEWIPDLLSSVLRHYGLGKEVVKSELYQEA